MKCFVFIVTLFLSANVLHAREKIDLKPCQTDRPCTYIVLSKQDHVRITVTGSRSLEVSIMDSEGFVFKEIGELDLESADHTAEKMDWTLNNGHRVVLVYLGNAFEPGQPKNEFSQVQFAR